MTSDFAKTRKFLEELNSKGLEYFATIDYCKDEPYSYPSNEADHYWSRLEETDQQTSSELQAELIEGIKTIANCMGQSSLLTEADRRDLGTWTKSVRASLRLRRYRAWDAEVLHDERMVLGIRQAGQSDENPVGPEQASRNFERDISNLLGLVDLLEVPPALLSDEFRANPQVTAAYEPDSAFVMMQIDRNMPELEDRYNAIKECFAEYRITAVRADEIEHQEVITDKIMEKIRASEFLMADLTGERPSVYYEIGYAHALKRRVIMYRSKGTSLHFDLAAYNCPEYINLSDLKKQLIGRLNYMTNRNPQNAGQ